MADPHRPALFFGSLVRTLIASYYYYYYAPDEDTCGASNVCMLCSLLSKKR